MEQITGNKEQERDLKFRARKSRGNEGRKDKKIMKKEGWREMQLLATSSWFASVGFNLGAEIRAEGAQGNFLQKIPPVSLSPCWENSCTSRLIKNEI